MNGARLGPLHESIRRILPTALGPAQRHSCVSGRILVDGLAPSRRKRSVFSRSFEGLGGIVVFDARRQHVQFALTALNRCAVKIGGACRRLRVARRTVVRGNDSLFQAPSMVPAVLAANGHPPSPQTQRLRHGVVCRPAQRAEASRLLLRQPRRSNRSARWLTWRGNPSSTERWPARQSPQACSTPPPMPAPLRWRSQPHSRSPQVEPPMSATPRSPRSMHSA